MSINLAGDDVDWDHVADRIAAKLGACGAAAACSKLADDERIRRSRAAAGSTLARSIALAALIVSAVGVWITWKSSSEDKPTRVVEQHQAVPLTLRGSADSDGRALTIVPGRAEPRARIADASRSRARSPIEVGSDGELNASDVEAALKDRDKEAKDVTHSVPVRIDARYVEAGTDRRGGGSYVLRYSWEGGGLFGGRSLRLVGLSR